MRVLFAVVLVGALVDAQDQTTPKLSWKERAKLDYQRRYDKYILHKKSDDENAIVGGDSGSESNAIPLGTRIGTPPPPPPAPAFRPPPPTTTFRPPPPPPPPSTTTFRPPPPPSTTPYRPPPPPSTTPYRPPSTTTYRPPPPPSTTPYRPPPPPTTTSTTTPRPPPPRPQPSTRRVEATTEAPSVGLRGAFPLSVDASSAVAPATIMQPVQPAQPVQPVQRVQQPVQRVQPVQPVQQPAQQPFPLPPVQQQGTVSGTFQSQPGTFAASPAGGGFASSSATAFSSGGVAGGSSSSSAGTYNAAGQAAGTFTISTGGSGSSSASATTGGAVNKSPVALLGKVVQGIVRPITSILPAPLGPKGSNPGLVGGLVSGIFEELDGGIRAIYPGTLWCGAGNVARSEDEVGVFRSTDKCCRQHDNCPDSIAAGATRHGLRNTGTFTRSHCDCDEAFYNCLRADRKSIVSVKVGTTYFNLLRPRCFRAVNPCKAGATSANSVASNCTATYRWFNNRLF